MIEIFTLLVVVLASLLITRVAAVALTLTGLTPDVAQFQARSALSGTGFATKEAEQITSHPARRQIVMTLMLVGNAGLVTTIATLSLSFGNVASSDQALQQFALLIGGLAVLLLLARNHRIAGLIARLAERLLRRYTDLDVADYHGLLHVGMDYQISRIRVRDGHWLADRDLASTKLTDEGMLVLGVERPDGTYLGAPRGDTHVDLGDAVLCYGPSTALEELRERPCDEVGDQAHRSSVESAKAREAMAKAADSSSRFRRLLRGRDRDTE